jgi:hypothetical protein
MATDKEEANNLEAASGYAAGRSSDPVRRFIAESPIGCASDDSIYAKNYRKGAQDQDDNGYKSADDCGTGESSSDSCCYITSACLDSMGLPRNSLEMVAMKELTKNHILKSFRGKREYLLYGRKAPAIVQAIESRPDNKKTWSQVYETLREITSTIVSGRYEEGHQQYKSLVLRLEDQFVKSSA